MQVSTKVNAVVLETTSYQSHTYTTNTKTSTVKADKADAYLKVLAFGKE